MKKIEKLTVFILIAVLLALNIFLVCVFFIIFNSDKDTAEFSGVADKEQGHGKELIINMNRGEYQVYQNDKLIKSFFDYNEAVNFASGYTNASVKRYNGNFWLWDNTPQYNVYIDGDEEYTSFNSFAEAVFFAKEHAYADVYYRKNNKFIWNNHESISYRKIDGVPLINQYPELKRGCEVTSLAMLLNFKGFNVDKITLAESIKKDDTPYSENDGKIYYGNPNNGFVGDIYDYQKKGLGVYHKPVYSLLLSYAGNDALDLTGCEFEDLYYFISKGMPVWIITNTKYNELPAENFEMWNTPDGQIRVTYNEHSVLITGYDENYIYINDPMAKTPNIKKGKSNFIKAWEQMGKQAVTIYK